MFCSTSCEHFRFCCYICTTEQQCVSASLFLCQSAAALLFEILYVRWREKQQQQKKKYSPSGLRRWRCAKDNPPKSAKRHCSAGRWHSPPSPQYGLWLGKKTENACPRKQSYTYRIRIVIRSASASQPVSGDGEGEGDPLKYCFLGIYMPTCLHSSMTDRPSDRYRNDKHGLRRRRR